MVVVVVVVVRVLRPFGSTPTGRRVVLAGVSNARSTVLELRNWSTLVICFTTNPGQETRRRRVAYATGTGRPAESSRITAGHGTPTSLATCRSVRRNGSVGLGKDMLICPRNPRR